MHCLRHNQKLFQENTTKYSYVCLIIKAKYTLGVISQNMNI